MTDARTRTPRPAADAASFLPLTPAVFHILLALSDADRHGYAIAREVAAHTDDTVKLGPGTLYGTIGRLLEAGLIVETSGAGSVSRKTRDDADERRRYYGLTSLGRAVARAETRRLSLLLDVARGKALITPGRAVRRLGRGDE
jgi:DNA-binding PadR family transcriptional regulator